MVKSKTISVVSIILIFIFMGSISFAEAKITEINFLNPEFVEIYSTNPLNLSNTTIFDENPGINSLSLVQNKDSSFYLIVGNVFLKNYNTSNLNCSIYSTGKSGPGNLGLKNSGENIFINLQNSLNLSWNKTKNLSFNLNESLNFNFNKKRFEVQNISPCISKTFPNQNTTPNSNLTLNVNQTINKTTNLTLNSSQKSNLNINTTTNLSNTNLTDIANITNCNQNFNISAVIQKNSRVEFKFKTNFSNFSIKYWIEDLKKNLVKSVKTTLNLNTKTFTPKDFSNIYLIKAQISNEECNKSDSKKIFFYSKDNSYFLNQIKTQTIPNNQNQHPKNSQNSQINQYPDSYLLILNREEISKGTSNILRYEVYKGDTAKRTVYIYLNNEKLTSFTLNKFEKKIGEFNFGENKGVSTLKLSGLGLEESILLENFMEKNISNSSERVEKIKKRFEIDNISYLRNNINFTINSNIFDNYGFCYILKKNQKISDEINISTKNLENSPKINSQLSLNLNIEKINKTKINSLRVFCKYKKQSILTFNTVSKDFNYSFNQKNQNIKFEEEVLKKKNLLEIEPNNRNLNSTLENSKEINTTDSYKSIGVKIKENSLYLIFAGIIIILIVFLFFW